MKFAQWVDTSLGSENVTSVEIWWLQLDRIGSR